MLRTLIPFGARYRGILAGQHQHRFFSSLRTAESTSEIELLTNLADGFMNKGKVRTAEDIYKNIIEKYPADKRAYEKLWDSWSTHRSLKVTEKELDMFRERYEQYIVPQTSISLSSK